MSETKQKIDKLIKSGTSKLSKGSWEKAIKDFQEVLKLTPNNTFAMMKIGDSMNRLGKAEEAVKYYNRAALRFAEEGSTIKAIAANKSILKLKPDSPGIKERLSGLSTDSQPAIDPGITITDSSAQKIETGDDSGETGEVDIKDLLMDTESRASEFSLSRKREAKGGDLSIVDRMLGEREKVVLLTDLTRNEFEVVVDKLASVEFTKGETIIKEGETGDSIFIIATGEVSVYRADEFGKDVWLVDLKEGESFGEYGFFSNSRPFATVKAKDDVTLLKLTRRDTEEIIEKHPGVRKVMIRLYKERVLDTLLALSPIFSPLSPEKRKELLKSFVLKTMKKGQMIVREGDPGDKMYVIQSGQAEVIKKEGEGTILLSRLIPGDFFGEASMITGKKRTASVVATQDMRILELSRDNLKKVSEARPEIVKTIKEYMDKRIEETTSDLKAFKDGKKGSKLI